DVRYVALVPLQHADRHAGFRLPDASGVIEAAGRGEVVAIRRPGKAVDVRIVANEGALEVARRGAPNSDNAVVPARCQVLPVRAQRDLSREPAVPLGLERP